MIFAGLKITVLGVGIVYLFLVLIVIAVNILYKLLKAETERELKNLEAGLASKKKKKPAPGIEDNVLAAVISAAVSAYRSGA